MKKKKRTSLGCLFWIALILLVVVIFLFNRENIKNVINRTNFKSIITNQKNKENKIKKPEVKVTTIKPQKEKTKPAKSNEVTIKIEEQTPPPEKNKTPKPEKPQFHIRKARIFFAYVDKSGKIHLKGVIKEVKFIDSPLRETLLTLLKGPDTLEMNRGLLTLIPRETKIKNIYIKHDVAYIDFSEDFRFNTLGVEGLKNQLKQVVYTATEFSNIKKVQILINGKIEKYLGPEGIYIGKPLSREDFEGN